ncbi:hypothetical protein SAMN02745146_2618 [Hymenobacter daecheongensis DSM 21074]|uniref:Uncharacterized protein n=1 Tax=Hymenobacter daecheongensis DSM 21074 TaxID=1121955 RepID=A0A1M6HSC6_9BACT|nr:hypothetical protein [Hymenobacter daecheongensis]SHJ25099.1 hypothetical protein SAMN02745146_2618 [Hymenobacter daecheongensis DSM 21074]
MPAPVTVPFLRRCVRWLAYRLFQLALLLAFVGHSAAGLWSPFRLGGDERQTRPTRPRRRPRLAANPALG